MRIYLIGMPASGKTTFGRALATYLDYSFVDMDEEIIKLAGKTIPEIFTQDGELIFRKLEQQVLHNLTGEKLVISTGGGAPCFFDNMDVIEQRGVSVFLDVPVKTLWQRVKEQTGTRPLLNGKDGDKLLDELIKKRNKRLAFYQRATLTLKENEIQLEQVIAKLNLTNQ
ncbi:MAG: shikimate kinase [Flammeovirgaceae bacterium]